MSAVKDQLENATHERKLVKSSFIQHVLNFAEKNKTGPYKAAYSEFEQIASKKMLGPLFKNDLEFINNSSVYVSTFRGNVILSIEKEGKVAIFTPRGFRPYDLPVIGGTADSLIKFCNNSGFDLKKLGLAGAFVSHGTSFDKAKSILEKGIDLSFAVKGNLGKAFYLTPDYKYAMNNFAKEMGRVDDKNAVVMMAQIDPAARIFVDGDGKRETDEILNNLGRDDVVGYMILKGVDGIFVPATNELAIFNTSVIKFLGAFDTSEIRAAQKRNNAPSVEF